MGLDELVKLLRFSEQPIMLHAANEIERLTKAWHAEMQTSAQMRRERDNARDQTDRLREAVEWLAHESVCGATKRFVEKFPDLAYLIWVPDGA